MKEPKLIVCELAGNCEQFIDLNLSAFYEHVDNIIIVFDTSSRDKTKEKLEKWKNKLGDKLTILEKEYKHNLKEKGANSEQRNFYLKYLQENFNNDFCLVIDMDEIIDENVSNLKKILLKTFAENEYPIISPRMVHLMYSFGLEDATRDIHYVPNRLFRINKDLFYSHPSEHTVLNSKNKYSPLLLNSPIIYHLAYCKEMFYIHQRFLTHQSKSDIHTQEQLKEWLMQHLSYNYPVKKFDITKLPKVLKQEFEIEDDFFYFKDRMNLETKHFLMVDQWKKFFSLTDEKNVLDIGCGFGHFLFCWQMFGIDAEGFDISSYAINSTPHKNIKNKMWVANATDDNFKTDKKYYLVTAIDVLEHLENEEQLDKVLQNMYNVGEKFFLFSIPFKGNPDLERDPTHKLKQTKEWWIEKIEAKGFRLFETPKEMYFSHQILLGIKNTDEEIRVI